MWGTVQHFPTNIDFVKESGSNLPQPSRCPTQQMADEAFSLPSLVLRIILNPPPPPIQKYGFLNFPEFYLCIYPASPVWPHDTGRVGGGAQRPHAQFCQRIHRSDGPVCDDKRNKGKGQQWVKQRRHHITNCPAGIMITLIIFCKTELWSNWPFVQSILCELAFTIKWRARFLHLL